MGSAKVCHARHSQAPLECHVIPNQKKTPKKCSWGLCAKGREEAVARIRAAVDARAEIGSDILVVARSDARQAESLEVGSWLTCLATLLSVPKWL